jgi:hypothetical protein
VHAFDGNGIERPWLRGRLRAVTERRRRQAYHAEPALKAEGELEQLARELAKTTPARPPACARA